MYHAVVGLRIDADLVRAIKIQALKENRSLQDITRDLWVDYLQKVTNESRGTPKTYFIQVGREGPIKIGVSENPNRELQELQTNIVGPLRILTVIEGNRKFELHKQFDHLRISDEWFGISSEMIEWLATNARVHGHTLNSLRLMVAKRTFHLEPLLMKSEVHNETSNRTGSRRRSPMFKTDSVPDEDIRNRAKVHEDGTGRRDKIRGKMDRRVRRGTVRRQK